MQDIEMLKPILYMYAVKQSFAALACVQAGTIAVVQYWLQSSR